MKAQKLITAIENDFTPIKNLEQLKELEPGTRIGISISRVERDFRVEQESACFAGYNASSEFYTFSFLDKPQSIERLTGFMCNESEIGFHPDGIISISGTPGIDLARNYCEPKYGEAYKRDLGLLKKSGLLPVNAK